MSFVSMNKSRKITLGKSNKTIMNIIANKKSITHEIITLKAFNEDKLLMSREQLKEKYYGYYEDNIYKINKDFMKVITTDNIDLFSVMYNTMGDIDKKINLFDIICRYNAIKCAKFLHKVNYPKIHPEKVFGVIGLCSLTHDFAKGMVTIVPPEKYLELSKWFLETFEMTHDYTSLFIVLVMSGKSDLLNIIGKDFIGINNNLLIIFIKKIYHTETLKWFISKVVEREQIHDVTVQLVLEKCDFKLWEHVYKLKEFDHMFHKLIPLIAERCVDKKFVDFICDKLDPNDTLYLNLYEIRNCFICNPEILLYMKSKGIKFKVVADDFSQNKRIKFYFDKYFNKYSNWFCVKISLDLTDDTMIPQKLDIFDDENYCETDYEDIDLYIWKSDDEKKQIKICQTNDLDVPTLTCKYLYCSRRSIINTIPLEEWKENEDKYLKLFIQEINKHTESVDELVDFIYENL